MASRIWSGSAYQSGPSCCANRSTWGAAIAATTSMSYVMRTSPRTEDARDPPMTQAMPRRSSAEASDLSVPANGFIVKQGVAIGFAKQVFAEREPGVPQENLVVVGIGMTLSNAPLRETPNQFRPLQGPLEFLARRHAPLDV